MNIKIPDEKQNWIKATQEEIVNLNKHLDTCRARQRRKISDSRMSFKTKYAKSQIICQRLF